MTTSLKQSPKCFVMEVLPLYHGPEVKIRITPSGHEYAISKGLLCAESPVFAAMFKGNFLESEDQMVTIEEMENVVSVQSLEALLQWIYMRTVKFDIEDPKTHISAAIELSRAADKYGITSLEEDLASYIKELLLCKSDGVHVESNTSYLTSSHIASAERLPRGHPVRRALACACVGGFLVDKNHKFAKETQDYPKFGADILQEVGWVLDQTPRYLRVDRFKDPLTGRKANLNNGKIGR